MNLAARCFEEGWGCEKAPAEAAEWYRRSAETGYFRAQFNYGVLLAQLGDGEAAAGWFSKALAAGDSGVRQAVLRVLAGTGEPALVALREGLGRGVAGSP
jgi:hypothetical protein